MNHEPLTIYCDGGARGNPGPAAYGFVARSGGKIVKEGNGYLGVATNNFAEYTAVVEALKWAKEKFYGQDIKFFLDSLLVASQLSGTYKVKNPTIREFVFKIRTLESDFGQITYTHVPREQNKDADRLVNEALDETSRLD